MITHRMGVIGPNDTRNRFLSHLVSPCLLRSIYDQTSAMKLRIGIKNACPQNRA
jgi:hypothetical protein